MPSITVQGTAAIQVSVANLGGAEVVVPPGTNAEVSVGGSSAIQVDVDAGGDSAILVSPGNAAGVTSLNGKTGSVSIAGGFGINSMPSPAGNGILISSAGDSRQNPDRMARLVTRRASGTFLCGAKSSTGYIAARWWDGSVSIFGGGSPSVQYAIQKAIPTTGSWVGSSPKEVFIWPCLSSSNSLLSGDLTALGCGNMDISILEVSGLSSLSELTCSGNHLRSLDVRGLASLQTLNCNSNRLESLELIDFPLLHTLNCSLNLSLSVLATPGCTSLATLNCEKCNLASLEGIGSPESLTFLSASLNPLGGLDASRLVNVTALYCVSIGASSLDFSPCASLQTLFCGGNLISSLDLSQNTQLISASCGQCASLASINLSGLAGLTYLNCEDCSLTSLDIDSLASLTFVKCNGNQLSLLEVGSLADLEVLFCDNNLLSSLDVSGTSISTLSCNNNQLTSLRAIGIAGSRAYYSSAYYSRPYYGGIMAANNDLDAAALNQLYTDLEDLTQSVGGYSIVFVGGNPGVSGDNPSIATAKNWIVLGS